MTWNWTTKFRSWAIAYLALLCASVVTSAGAAPLKAGVARTDITPPPGIYLLGSGEVIATGTLDPLYARVLILEGSGKRIALVTLDLCRVFQAPLIAQLRRHLQQSNGIDYLFITASHTHSGPIIPLNEDKPLDAMTSWQTNAVTKIERAVDEARRREVPVRIGTGYGIAYIGHNRRRINADGSVTMFFSNPTRIPTSPVDPTVAVLRIDETDGTPLAVLVNYACHPVVIMGQLAKYSADYPGVMCRTVEQQFGGKPLCFFLQGASGDIDTYYTGVPKEQEPLEKLAWTGERIGNEAARVAKAIRTQSEPDGALSFSEDLLSARWRWGPGKFEEVMRRINPPALLPYYLPLVKPELQLPVGALLLNKRIAFMSVPGEAFVDFQMNFRARCPVNTCFFLGYTNGFVSYLPTIRAAVAGGHGGATWTRVEPGTGERMVDQGIVQVYRLLGRLSDTPQIPSH